MGRRQSAKELLSGWIQIFQGPRPPAVKWPTSMLANPKFWHCQRVSTASASKWAHISQARSSSRVCTREVNENSSEPMRRQGEQVAGRFRHKETGTSRGSEFCVVPWPRNRPQSSGQKCGSQMRDEKILLAQLVARSSAGERERHPRSSSSRSTVGGSSGGGVHSHQLSIHGAVSELCEEYSVCQTSTGRPVVAEQSDPFFAPADLLIMTPTSSIEIPANEEYLLQRKRERIEKLSQQDRLSKFCTDAGFLTTVEVGQYFMTKDTE